MTYADSLVYIALLILTISLIIGIIIDLRFNLSPSIVFAIVLCFGLFVLSLFIK